MQESLTIYRAQLQALGQRADALAARARAADAALAEAFHRLAGSLPPQEA
jgi:hypothetical protein